MFTTMDFVHLSIGLVLILLSRCTNAVPRVQMSIPIPQVKVGGILSLYCRIHELETKQKVTISRNDDNVRLTWGEFVERGVDERTFLAVRHQSDGSIVHFLTITNVQGKEEGVYRCSVRDDSTLQEITGDNTSVKVQHLPDSKYPQCVPSVPLIVNEGDLMSFNCTTQAALPEVDMAWSHTRDLPILGRPTKITNGQYRILTLQTRVSMLDDGAMYVCTITSRAFPDFSKTCHVGPLKVTRNPLATFKPKMPNFEIAATTPKPNLKQDLEDIVRHSTTMECQEYCSSLSTPTFYWVIATVVSASFAFLFIFITAILMIKYCRTTNKRHNQCASEMQIYGGDDIYTELDAIPEGVKQVYMSLKKPVQVGNDTATYKLTKGRDDVIYTMTTTAFHPDSNF